MKPVKRYFAAAVGIAACVGLLAARDDAFRWAAKNGRTNAATFLLGAGADVHAANNAALRLAEENDHAETAQVLKDWMKRDDAARRRAAPRRE